jgi:HEAT repeat protein
MKLRVLALVIVALAPAHPGFSEDDVAAKERTRQTLRYGIDSQALEAIRSITAARDATFTKELAEMLAERRSPEVRKAVLALFQDQKLKEGEPAATALLEAWQDAPGALLVSAIRYLSAIGSAGLAERLGPVTDATDASAAVAAIQALGATGDAAATTLLVGKLKSTAYPESRKSEIILALGSLKDAGATDVLLEIAGNPDDDKVRRMYAADGLGRIGDLRALPVLEEMVAEKDALIRLYALSALSRFDLKHVFPRLIEGLRDESAKIREQCARALGRELDPAQAAVAVPILSYKAEFDPEAIVRLAAIKALGEVWGDAAIELLRRVYRGADHPLDSRESALGSLVARALTSTIDAIRAVIDEEWKSNDQRVLQSTARVLSTAKGGELKDLYLRLLDSTDPVVRSYAVRGIVTNGFSDLKERIRQMADKDPNPGTRQEAAAGVAKL